MLAILSCQVVQKLKSEKRLRCIGKKIIEVKDYGSTKKALSSNTRTYMDEEYPADARYEEEWRFAGETWAVSEAKAISNVRYRTRGKESMMMPLSVSNSGAVFRDWMAEVIS